MPGEPLGRIDTAWLRMDSPVNHMMVAGFFELAGPVDEDRLIEVLEQRLLRFDRFRQLIVDPGRWSRPRWEFDPALRLTDHLTRHRPAGDVELRRLLDRLASSGLPKDRALWHVDIIERPDGTTMLFVRLHHTIGDGVALTGVLLSLCDHLDGSPAATDGVMAQPRFERTGDRRKVLGAAAAAAGYLRAFGRLVLLPPDRRTPFKGKLGEAKRTAWSEPIDLDDLKSAGKAHGATINDVLLASVAGSLGRYLRERGDRRSGLRIRAMVPVNLRRNDDWHELGNRFGLVVPVLPVGIEDPVERLGEMVRHMRSIKATPEAIVSFAILQAMGTVSPRLHDWVVKFFGTKSTAVMTNVPGPREQLALAGVPIQRLMFWVPQAGGMGMGVSLLSYNGRASLGIMTDAALTPNPDLIVTGFYDEFERLRARA